MIVKANGKRHQVGTEIFITSTTSTEWARKFTKGTPKNYISGQIFNRTDVTTKTLKKAEYKSSHFSHPIGSF